MRSYDLVVCGGGAAGHAALRAYREAGGDGTVLLATREDRLPYARPPLSKEYLRGEMTAAELALDDVAWYAAKEIVTALGSPVRGLDAAHRRLLLAGETIDFTTVVLATGASPAALPVRGGDDPAILRLRDPRRQRPHPQRRRPRQRRRDRLGLHRLRGRRVAGAHRHVACSWSARRPCRRRRCSAPTPASASPGGSPTRASSSCSAAPCSASRTAARWSSRTVARSAPTRSSPAPASSRTPTCAHRRAWSSTTTASRATPSMQTVAPGVLVAGDAAYAWNAAAGRRLVVQHWGEAERMGEIAGPRRRRPHDAWTQAPGFWSTIGDHTLKHVAWGDGHDETRLIEGGDDDTFAVLYGRARHAASACWRATSTTSTSRAAGWSRPARRSHAAVERRSRTRLRPAIPLPEPNSRIDRKEFRPTVDSAGSSFVDGLRERYGAAPPRQGDFR